MKRLALLFALMLLFTLPAAHGEEAGDSADAFLVLEEEDGTPRLCILAMPDYTFVGGCYNDATAQFLMDRPDGTRVFVGGVYENGAWTWTESTPLPAGTTCDSYHSGNGSLILCVCHPDDAFLAQYGEARYTDYAIYLQQDGRWLVETIISWKEEAFHFEEGGLYISHVGLIHGECRLERDVTKIDWAAYPLCLSDVLPWLCDDWAVIRDPHLPLYTDEQAGEIIGHYHIGTPLRILAHNTQHDSGLVQVSIADSRVTGWISAHGLLRGADQLQLYCAPEQGGPWDEAEEVRVPSIDVRKGAALYAAPDGPVISADLDDAWLQLLSADVQEGWYHVCFMESAISGYIRITDCLSPEE